MKKRFLGTVVVTANFVADGGERIGARAARRKGPEVARDPDMEQDSLHNLEVARQYFKLRKAYVASLERCEEVLAGNPAFSKIDEILFIGRRQQPEPVGGEGKAEAGSICDPRRRKEDHAHTAGVPRQRRATICRSWSTTYPQSKFKEDALANLKSLGGAKPKQNNAPPETAAQKTKSKNKRSNH
jgi:hypothetical protein